MMKIASLLLFFKKKKMDQTMTGPASAPQFQSASKVSSPV
jgi:hypothetical protein